MQKSLARKIGVIAMVTLSAGLLTACDPPPPPELLAQLAEQNPTCLEGEVSVSGSASFEAVIAAWSEALPTTCAEPLPPMTMALASDVSAAQIVFSVDALSEGTAFAAVPVALDSAVLSYNVPNIDSLVVSYKTLAKIIDGSISNWNDPALASDNPNTELPDLPLNVHLQAEANSLKAIGTLLETHQQNFDFSRFEGIAMNEFSSPELGEGDIVIQPNSLAIVQGSATLGFLTGGTNKDTGEVNQAFANEESLTSAGTQLVSKKDGSVLGLYLDTKLEPKPLFEGETAAVPYQAIFPVMMYLVGEDALLTRAVAMYNLRMDSQGALGYANLVALPEAIRVEAIGVVSKGLPTPTVAPKSE